jgi:hypothetical protein
MAEKASFSTNHTQGPDRQERFQARREEAGPITQQWQPSLDAQQILQRAGIKPQFIQDSIPEFVLYWQENGTPQCSWSTKFLQYVKRQWAHQSKLLTETSNGKQQGYSKGRIRDRSFVEDLTDRSWAS